MKKLLLKVFGVAALAAGMLYNVQVSEAVNGTDISLAALGNVAVAQEEDDPNVAKDAALVKRMVTCDFEPYFFNSYLCEYSKGSTCYCSSEYSPC